LPDLAPPAGIRHLDVISHTSCTVAHAAPGAAAPIPTLTPLQYRTARNYACFDYLAARLFGKVIFALIVMSLYFGIGSNFAADNTQTWRP
jgi:hypothetical protein